MFSVSNSRHSIFGYPSLFVTRSDRTRLVLSHGLSDSPATLTVKTFSGETLSEEKLQLNTAKEATANHVVHRYLTTFLQNQRQGSANSKNRSEVRGGGKKPYTQKKTGNARRGTNRSPLMPGGGILFGPKPRDWSITMTKKERRIAMATALQKSAEIMTVVNSLESMKGAKTKTLVEALVKLGADPMREKVLLITKVSDHKLIRTCRNVEMLSLRTMSSINIFEVINANKIVLERDVLAHINEFYGPPRSL
jgi:large subunit ribosomal protein L4